MTADQPVPLHRSSFAQAFGQALVVFRHEFKQLLLSTRTLASMAIYAGFAALSMSVYVFISNRARQMASEQFGEKALDAIDQQSEKAMAFVLKATGWSTSLDSAEADAAELFRDHVPMLVLFFFALASVFLPLLVAWVTFDQFSELSTRGARFALLRVRRGAYMAGKLTASVTAIAVFLAVMWTVVAAMTAWRDGTANLGIILAESARDWILMVVLALPYISMTAFVSSIVRPAFAFVLTVAAWGGLFFGSKLLDWIIPALFETSHPRLVGYGRDLLVLFPWQHASKLLSRDFGTLMEGVGALLLLAAAGGAMTFGVVRNRDV